jgi:hypothetical protein
MLVEQKLRGVYGNVDVEVPFRAFDNYIDVLMEYLDEYDIQKTRLEVCENPLVIEAFNTALNQMMGDIEFDELCEYVDDDTVSFAFKPEMDEIARIEAEEQAERDRLAEIARQEQAERDRKQRELEAMTEVQITINKKHLNKAIALLQAAGLMKKAK